MIALLSNMSLNNIVVYNFNCTKCGMINMLNILPSNNIRKCSYCAVWFNIKDVPNIKNTFNIAQSHMLRFGFIYLWIGLRLHKKR